MTGLATLLLRRLLAAVFVCVSAAALLFLAFSVTPGDPVSAVYGFAAAGQSLPQPVWGPDAALIPLDDRAAQIIAAWQAGAFGRSFRVDDAAVIDIVTEALPATLFLAAAALALATPLGVGLGAAAAMSGAGRRRFWATLIFTICLSLPAVALTAGLAYWLAASWRLLPTAGWENGWSAVMPVIVLAAPAVGHIGRMTCALASDIMPLAHVRTARAKGLPHWRVAWFHVLRNIAAPLASFVGAVFSGILGGTLLVETLFAIPGLGHETVTATLARDFPVALGGMLALIGVNVAVGAITDMMAAALDPRGGGAGDWRPAGEM